MVKRSKRKRSVKHYMKEYEYSQDTYSNVGKDFESPVRTEMHPQEPPQEEPMEVEQENVAECKSQNSEEEKQTPKKARRISPLPHEIYKQGEKDEMTACNIYNFSPSAVEKRQKMASKRDEMEDFQKSDLLPRLLDMNKQAEPISHFPLVLTKSLSEG